MACNEESSLPDVKLFVCTLCTKVYLVTRTDMVIQGQLTVAITKLKCQALYSQDTLKIKDYAEMIH